MRALLTSRTSALLLGLVLVGSVASSTTSAVAAPRLGCGSTLTANTTLTRDLRCSGGGTGLVLAAGVTLDLGGHRLSGDGTGQAVVTSGTSNATVRNGRIDRWASAVAYGNEAADGGTLVLDKLTVSRAPLSVSRAALTLNDSTIKRSNLSVVDSYLSVTGSRLDRSDVDLAGVATFDKAHLARSAVQISQHGSVSMTDSVLDGHGRDVVPIGCSDGERTFLRSTVKRYDRAMNATEDCSTTVTDSTFSHNRRGVFVSPSGPSSRTAEVLTVRTSKFDHDATAITGQGFVVESSTFSHNRTGIRLDGPANILSSTFRRNTKDGLYAADGDTPLLKDNLAVRNHRYGLYAPGSLDEGGNRAHDNGKADCIGVTCTS